MYHKLFLVLHCQCIYTHSPKWEKSVFPVTCVHIQTHHPIFWDHAYDTSSPIPPAARCFLILVEDVKLFVERYQTRDDYLLCLFCTVGAFVWILRLPSILVRP